MRTQLDLDPDAGTGRRSLPLVCSPPKLAADTEAKRLADRLLPTGAGQWIFFAAVAAAVSAAPSLPIRAGLALGAAGTLAGSWWCLVNFRRCREAHCAVTGPAWAALGVLGLVEAGLGRSLVNGNESALFAAVLVVALVFECAWRWVHGTNALALASPPGPARTDGVSAGLTTTIGDCGRSVEHGQPR